MQETELQKRHKQFAIRIIKMVDAMPHTISSMAIARQIVRSGTSPSANRAACIAKSEKDFINKLKMVEEELDETLHWLTLIEECEMLPSERMQDIINECTELLKITISSIVSTRKSINEPKETK